MVQRHHEPPLPHRADAAGRRGSGPRAAVLAAGLVALAALAACARAPRETSEPVLRLYLARHGQTQWNLERRLQGRTDVELNETGRAQAQALAERLRGVALDAIYSSSLSRSRETATIVAGTRPVESLADLDERALGRFEGVYMDGRQPDEAAAFDRRAGTADDTLDGGESREQHHARVARAWAAIRERWPSGSVLVVGHGGTNQGLLRAVAGLSPEAAESVRQANDELYLIELTAGRPPALWKLVPPDRLEEL